jgi:hypothetical protein
MVNYQSLMIDVTGQLKPYEAKKLIMAIIAAGGVFPSTHAKQRMAEREMEMGDILCTLRGGLVREPEFENGSWRYRVETQKITVIVSIRSETKLTVVTAWRNP